MMKFLYATLAASCCSFLLNTILYRFTTDLTVLSFVRDVPVVEWMLIGHFSYAALLVYIFPFGYEGGPSFGEGARFGAIMGLLTQVPFGFYLRSIWEVPVSFPFILESASRVLIGAIIGVLIARVYVGKVAPGYQSKEIKNVETA